MLRPPTILILKTDDVEYSFAIVRAVISAARIGCEEHRVRRCKVKRMCTCQYSGLNDQEVNHSRDDDFNCRRLGIESRKLWLNVVQLGSSKVEKN